MEVGAIFCTRMDFTKMFVMSLNFEEIEHIKVIYIRVLYISNILCKFHCDSLNGSVGTLC